MMERPAPWAARIGIPLAMLAVLLGILVWANPASLLSSSAPPAETIAFDRVDLEPGRIVLALRNAANAEVSVAQVMVDDAFWAYTLEPDGAIAPFGSSRLTLEYPWVEGEPVVIGVLSGTGLVWEHEIEVATATPVPDAQSLGVYALIGLLVGALPILAGVALFPLMRSLPARAASLILAFTLGLLAFLLVDTLGEGLELADELPGAYHGLALLAGSALLALVAVLGLEAFLRRRAAGPAVLAVLIAVGIGLHNLGEGLVIGSAFAIGSLALGTALVAGFAIHNVTEGPAIVAPLLREARTRWGLILGVALMAGLPTVLGAWMGAFWRGGVLPVVFFGLGAGAIVVVLVQVGRAMLQDGDRPFSAGNAAAFAVGYAVMLGTALMLG